MTEKTKAQEALETHGEIFEAVFLECLQSAWDQHCSDTGCFPDDMTLVKKTLEFKAGRFSIHAAAIMFNTPYIKDIYRAALQQAEKVDNQHLIDLAERTAKEKHTLQDKVEGLVRALEGLSTISSEPDKQCKTLEFVAVRQIAREALAAFKEGK